MALEIFWTDFAKNELKNIFKFYKTNVGLNIARKISKGIVAHTLTLSNQLEIGSIEPLLKDRKHKFRYLVYKNYKIIYSINIEKQRIEINDVFDTRQNPIKLERKKD